LAEKVPEDDKASDAIQILRKFDKSEEIEVAEGPEA